MATYMLTNATLFPSFSDHIKTVPAPFLAIPLRHLPTVKSTGRQEWLLSFIKHLVSQRNLWLVLQFSLTTSLKGWSIKHWWRNRGPGQHHQHDKSSFPWKRLVWLIPPVKSYGVDWVFTLIIKGLWELHQHNQCKWLVLMAFQNSTSELMISRCIFLQLVQTVLSFLYGILIFPKAEQGAWGLRREVTCLESSIKLPADLRPQHLAQVGARYTMNGWLNEPESGKRFFTPATVLYNKLFRSLPCFLLFRNEVTLNLAKF